MGVVQNSKGAEVGVIMGDGSKLVILLFSLKNQKIKKKLPSYSFFLYLPFVNFLSSLASSSISLNELSTFIPVCSFLKTKPIILISIPGEILGCLLGQNILLFAHWG